MGMDDDMADTVRVTVIATGFDWPEELNDAPAPQQRNFGGRNTVGVIRNDQRENRGEQPRPGIGREETRPGAGIRQENPARSRGIRSDYAPSGYSERETARTQQRPENPAPAYTSPLVDEEEAPRRTVTERPQNGYEGRERNSLEIPAFLRRNKNNK